MEGTGIRQQVVDEIRSLAQKYEVRKVILFGSRARGDFREKSEDTSTLLKFDIVDLDEKIQEELMESIQREGRVLYEKI